MSFKCAKLLQHIFQTILGIKNCRLIHIIPESLNSLIQKEFILIAKPVSCFFVQHIRKQSLTRPYSCNKGTSVFFGTEISFLQSLFIDIVSLFLFHTGINDWYQMNILFFHFLIEFCELRKCLIIQCKIFVPFHIINIQINAVQGNSKLTVSFHHFPNLILVHIAPTALTITKCPQRSNIASSHHMTKLLHDIFHICTCNEIHIQIPVGSSDFQFVMFCVSHIKGKNARIVHKNTKLLFSIQHQKIVCAIQRTTVFLMFRFIATFALINPASFINSTNIFS